MGFSRVDALLRREAPYGVRGEGGPWLPLVAITGCGGLLYGATMGAYGLPWDARPLQALYSGVKVPCLLAVATVVALPSFYVIHALLGLGRDFPAALRAVLAAQATLAVALASLAPVTVVFYLSIDRYSPAPLFNGLQFLVATLAGQVTLTRHYAPLVRANPRHRIVRRAWLAVYVFVGIQMAWVLRPFVGSPLLPTRFFREDAWTNAYVSIADAIWRLLRGE